MPLAICEAAAHVIAGSDDAIGFDTSTASHEPRRSLIPKRKINDFDDEKGSYKRPEHAEP
jgi:hypothetical protein